MICHSFSGYEIKARDITAGFRWLCLLRVHKPAASLSAQMRIALVTKMADFVREVYRKVNIALFEASRLSGRGSYSRGYSEVINARL